LEKKKKNTTTELNEYDRKILDKYANYYTGFVGSNPSNSDIQADKRYKEKEL
jgi:hypothetical protein